MTLFKGLPSISQLKEEAANKSLEVKKVNGHFHTPYSFSAFKNMEQVMKMAEMESVDVIGINDFYTMAGYEEFAKLSLEYKKFPLFNIEFMGLLKHEQAEGIRVNDPSNPGRTYFSGKGLDFPVTLAGESKEKLNAVRREADMQTMEMVEKASAHLIGIDPDLHMDYDTILKYQTSGMVRERHIARAIRMMVFAKYRSLSEREEIITQLFGGIKPASNMDDAVALEGEIRSVLLKSGGVAFVKEDPRAFLDIDEVIRIILDAGGIPCYPVLLDDKHGNYTEFEADKEKLHEKLLSHHTHSIELIPGRNRISNLKNFVEFFDSRGFVITFGTEHNTPALDPLTVTAADAPLDGYLEKVSYEGACIIAAHQFLRSRGESGFVNSNGDIAGDRNELMKIGNAIINYFIH